MMFKPDLSFVLLGLYMYLVVGVLIRTYDDGFRTQLEFLRYSSKWKSNALSAVVIVFWPFRGTLRTLIHKASKRNHDPNNDGR